jgi:hypothetical protein
MKGNLIAMYILGGLIVFGIFAVIGLMIFKPVPQENSVVLNILLGALVGGFTGVYGYFFGSSAGSKEKTQMLADKTPTKPEQTL